MKEEKGGPFWCTVIQLPSPTGKAATKAQKMRVLANEARAAAGQPTVVTPVLVDPVELAAVIAHETGHWAKGTLRMSNRDLHGSGIYGVHGGDVRARYAWAAQMPVRVAEERKPDGAAQLEHAQAKLKQALARKRRAETIVTKWERRVAALERKLQ